MASVHDLADLHMKEVPKHVLERICEQLCLAIVAEGCQGKI